MNDYLSESLREELNTLPDDILLQAFSVTREEWFLRQNSAEDFLSMLALGEALHARGLEAPPLEEEEAALFAAAVEDFLCEVLIEDKSA